MGFKIKKRYLLFSLQMSRKEREEARKEVNVYKFDIVIRLKMIKML